MSHIEDSADAHVAPPAEVSQEEGHGPPLNLPSLKPHRDMESLHLRAQVYSGEDLPRDTSCPIRQSESLRFGLFQAGV